MCYCISISIFFQEFHPIKFQADKIIQDVEKRCEQKIEELKEESRQHLLQVQEEHAEKVSTQFCLVLGFKFVKQ